MTTTSLGSKPLVVNCSFHTALIRWLICAYILVTVNSITYSRITGAEIWITSDGRAYFVHLSENVQPNLSELASVSNANGSEVHTPPVFNLI